VREQVVDNAVRAADVVAGVGRPPPDRARVVVIGGGIVGTSVAFHLATGGERDVVVLERARLTSGTNWHAAGLLAGARATHALTEIASYTTEVYAGLEAETGLDIGFNRRGSLAVARVPERMTELRYQAAMAHHHGMEAHELRPEEIRGMQPLVDPTGLVGAVHYPEDATVNPGGVTLALAKLAAASGAGFREGVPVQEILVRDGRVHGVSTAHGTIECEVVALCAGLWSPRLARACGARLAMHAAEHMWVISGPIEGCRDELPYVRDLDGYYYARGYRGGLLVGAFEPHGKPRTEASIPADFAFGEFAPDPEHFGLALDRARDRLPGLRDAPIERWLNAPESFTPDGTMLLGETPEVAGLYVATGMNSQGILMGAGTGRALAEWILEGAPTIDSSDLDVGRFATAQTTRRYLFDRTRETLGRLYAMHWPQLQPETARDVRRTPLYDRLHAARACFGELAGWERANWYAPAGVEPRYEYSYGRPGWFDAVAAEHRAAREGVALFDLSSFAKFLVQGPGALALVQRVFGADLDVADGKVTYTTLLNRRGGIEADLTVTRLGERRFLVVAPTVTERRVGARLQRAAAAQGDAAIADVTAALATLAVAGPRSRALLGRLTDADLGSARFPFATAQRIEAGPAEVLAVRVSFTGELGWELYAPSESAAALFDALVGEGADEGLRLAGYFALDTLRAEKGFRHWGADIGPADTPLETGLGFTVSWDKPDFVGREALAARRSAPGRRRLVHVCLEDAGPQLHHGESLLRNGRIAGRVTSGAYGHTLGAAVGLAFAEADALDGAWEVAVAGDRVPARVSARPFYDPDGARMRA